MKMNATVIIVGAGPAGLGCALALQACGVEDLIVLDRDGVGASFERWPVQMRLLTPSFHSNAFGAVDLNAISPATSPADFLRTEHPTGQEYARYLKAVALHYDLPIRDGARVDSLEPVDGGIELQTSEGVMRARFVIWAVGEFSRPDTGGIEGADLCLHNGEIRDWEEVAAGQTMVALIGGYESGVDAAIHLMRLNKKVHLFTRGQPWESVHPDPSRALSPHTHDRLKAALLTAGGTVHFHKNADITRVLKTPSGFQIIGRESEPFDVPSAPVLCTGFCSALEPLRNLWEWRHGQPVFTEEADESTRVPGLFYSGPSLEHRGMLFCFIYKFRSRFGIIAREIAERLHLDWENPLALWKRRGFMLEDLSCCTDCKCAIAAESNDAGAELYEGDDR